MLTTFSQNLTPQEAFEIRPTDKRRAKINSLVHFAKFKLLVVRFYSFFAKRSKPVEKKTRQKKNKVL